MSASGTKLRHLVEPVDTWSPAKDAPDDLFVYVDLSSVDRGLKEITAPQGMTGAEAPSRARQRLKKGDVLVSTVRPNLNAVAHVSDEFDGATGSTGFCVLRADPKDLDSTYLFHWTRSPAFIAAMVRRATGASYPAVSDRIVKESKIPLPPLPEQRRIAAILDKADAVRRKRRQTLDLADRFLRSAFLDLFGDPGIPSATIGDLLAQGLLLVHKDGNHGSQYPRAEEFGDEGIPFLTARSITDSGAINDTQVQRLAEEKARQLKIGWLAKDDVLLAHNATVGRTAIYRGEYREALIGTSLTAFRTDSSGLVPMYLLGALRSARFQHQLASMMSQTTRNQVPITAQRRLSIPVPRIEEQREYALLVEKAAHHSMNLSRGSVTVQELQDSLTQRAFRGEL